MENNKYYTPSIEEFYVGFEYEYWNNTTNEWCSTVLGNGPITLFFADYLGIDEPDNYRVKYLDKEDIESLGFDKTFKSEFGIEYLFYENKDYQYCLYHIKENVIIFRADKNVSWMFPPSFSEAYRPIFSGTIKNKSELKRVFKQVGVL